MEHQSAYLPSVSVNVAYARRAALHAHEWGHRDLIEIVGERQALQPRTASEVLHEPIDRRVADPGQGGLVANRALVLEAQVDDAGLELQGHFRVPVVDGDDRDLLGIASGLAAVSTGRRGNAVVGAGAHHQRDDRTDHQEPDPQRPHRWPPSADEQSAIPPPSGHIPAGRGTDGRKTHDGTSSLR